MLNNKELQTSLISRVFATHFAVGCFHASYERHFVKIIQHQLLSFHAVYYQFYIHCKVGVFRCKKYHSFSLPFITENEHAKGRLEVQNVVNGFALYERIKQQNSDRLNLPKCGRKI